MPNPGTNPYGAQVVSAAKASQERVIQLAAGGITTGDTMLVSGLVNLALHVRQTAGDALFIVNLQVQLVREWRTIKSFDMAAFPGPTIEYHTMVAARSARVVIDYQGGTAVAAAGWWLLSAFSL